MSKELNLDKPVAELVEKFPELKKILSDAGFTEITNPIALNTVGRIVTIPRGAAIKNFNLEEIISKLESHGFTVKKNSAGDFSQDRAEFLKNMIQRLNDGESLESVRKDFVKNFSSVSAEEISDAEQKIIDEGTPVEEVQQLCDVHSALMHENIENPNTDFPNGHPAKILQMENSALTEFIANLEKKLLANEIENVIDDFKKLNAIHSHYGKKETLFMPLLYNYGVTGPSQVMWGVDDEIKLSVRTINKKLSAETFDNFKPLIKVVLRRIKEMVFKEEKIFIPLSQRFFSEKDWLEIYRDMQEYDFAFIQNVPKWAEGEKFIQAEENNIGEKNFSEDKIIFPTGELTFQQLKGILKILPLDITFIDAEEKVRFFINEGQIFNRPKLALGNDIFNCHPPKVFPIIKKMLEDFKAKKRDRMEVKRFIKGKPVFVQYIAVYDDFGEYVGTVEFVQDFAGSLEVFSEK